MLRDSRPENTASSQDMEFSGIWRLADKRPPMLEYNRTSGQPRDGTSTNSAFYVNLPPDRPNFRYSSLGSYA